MGEDKPRILIVDDDGEIRDVLKEFLGRDYDCVTRNSAEKALDVLATQHFDLILSDIGMTAMSGIEMLPRVVELAPDSVVVMISGQRTIEFAIDAMRAGAFDYITKPFELREVNAVVRRALDHQRNLKKFRALDRDKRARRQELLDAVTRQEFVVYYQPQIDIHSRAVVGAEALVRWQHPHFGLQAPAEFISVAEDTGLINQIGELVLREACARTRQWQEQGLDTFRIAVNASPRQLHEKNFAEIVARILSDTQLSPESLELEVTETWLMQNLDAGVHALEQLREMGVRIALDDFGTGYSSLSYLKRLPIDSVKLDASFVKDATTDPDDAALVMAIITLAHTLGKTVIAEGIEREDQLALLRMLRCDEGQGYLFGRPMPALDSIFRPPTAAAPSPSSAQLPA
jgi:EAL domain-containing protein (putative c-di-GMP-specific phosphodiesterase class I)/CheY-like chemotaxis protein